MRYVKYMPDHSMEGASRNKREIFAALEHGFSASVFSDDKQLPDDAVFSAVKLINDGKIKLNPKIPKWKRIIFILCNYFNIFYRTCKLEGDVWSCHDLPALRMAWFASRLRKVKPQLIYDSHEFELGRNAVRSKGQIKRIAFWEKFLMKRCAFSIMVNDTIADEVQRIHGLKERAVVIRSTPEYWEIDEAVCAEKRREFLSELRPDAEEEAFLVMYHGGLLTNRGIETVIELTAMNPNICAVILGNGSAAYTSQLKKLAEELNVGHRVVFHPAVPQKDLWQYVGAVDLELMLIQPVVKSYYYALPNKFFEAVQSVTPMVASDLPEMKALIDRYDIGLCCDIDNIEYIHRCVERMRTDKEFYARCRENLKTAKEELCWENEKQVLKEAFAAYIKP